MTVIMHKLAFQLTEPMNRARSIDLVMDASWEREGEADKNASGLVGSSTLGQLLNAD